MGPGQRQATCATGWLAGMALGLLATLGPVAAEVPGAAAPAFDAALAAWLADDEATALPALAALAAEGSAAARLLLGLIDKSPALQGPWLAQLNRTERLALMRAPGGLSGRSWLATIPEVPIAAAWMVLLHTEADAATGARMAALGEARAAREALATLAAREHPDLRHDWHDWVDPELAFLVWPRASAELRARIAALVPADHPQWALMGRPVAAEAWDAWLDASPAAAPLAALCAAACPETAAACRRAAHAALGSHAAVLTLGSPVEALVPQARFLASPRSDAATLRRMLLTVDMRGRAALIQRAGAIDSCLGGRLGAEADRYRRTREGRPVEDG